MDILIKINKECKNWNKQDIQDIFTDKFQHDMAYGHFTDLARRTALDKVLRDKEFSIAKNPKYGRYQRGLASMIKSLKILVLIMKLNKINN